MQQCLPYATKALFNKTVVIDDGTIRVEANQHHVWHKNEIDVEQRGHVDSLAVKTADFQFISATGIAPIALLPGFRAYLQNRDRTLEGLNRSPDGSFQVARYTRYRTGGHNALDRDAPNLLTHGRLQDLDTKVRAALAQY